MKQLILFSSENDQENEIESIIKVLAKTKDSQPIYFHLRKPHYSKARYRKFLAEIPAEFHPKIRIHQYHELIEEFKLAGIHLTGNHLKNKSLRIEKIGLSKSRGFHSIDELKNDQENYDYVFLSPIFDSISKHNYKSKFDLEELQQELKQINQVIIALGGIEKNNLESLENIGFQGIAILGAVWNFQNPYDSFLEIKNMFFK